jgi:hypothetical protein
MRGFRRAIGKHDANGVIINNVSIVLRLEEEAMTVASRQVTFLCGEARFPSWSNVLAEHPAIGGIWFQPSSSSLALAGATIVAELIMYIGFPSWSNCFGILNTDETTTFVLRRFGSSTPFNR